MFCGENFFFVEFLESFLFIMDTKYFLRTALFSFSIAVVLLAGELNNI